LSTPCVVSVMSSAASEPPSIAAQLVRLFTPASVLLLCAGLGLLYWIVVRHAFEEDNTVLADKLAAVRADLGESGNPAMLAEELKSARATQPPYYVRLIAADGRTIGESAGMAELLPASQFPAITAPTEKFREGHFGGKFFALGTTDGESRGQRFTIQVAQDRSADERFEKEFGLVTIVILGIGAVLSIVIARTVVNRGLRPVHAMTDAVARIGPTQLAERIGARGWPIELRPLANAFDAMLERLENSFTRLSQFSADLAHELRTPLTNMLGEAQVALTRSRQAEEYRAVLESQIDEYEKLAHTIDNLLFLARAEGAERHVERELFDARAAAEKVASYYSAAAEERAITITCDGHAKVAADPVLFNRALTNLLDNALRFTSNGGAIHIGLRSGDGATELSVNDNGSGIPAEHIPRVFDRFYRVDASRSSAATGLGLSLVRSIAELHGGAASISSEPGSGTTVRLVFPS
jgi:two-component system heavy metal sensor histidine kinase CusS